MENFRLIRAQMRRPGKDGRIPEEDLIQAGAPSVTNQAGEDGCTIQPGLFATIVFDQDGTARAANPEPAINTGHAGVDPQGFLSGILGRPECHECGRLMQEVVCKACGGYGHKFSDSNPTNVCPICGGLGTWYACPDHPQNRNFTNSVPAKDLAAINQGRQPTEPPVSAFPANVEQHKSESQSSLPFLFGSGHYTRAE
jgi:hypothetical protein